MGEFGVLQILELIGGLAFFLYGMRVMSEALEKSQGSKMKSILEKLTSSPFKGLLLGTAVTAVMQSSSATTVMIIGFVNSGIMTFSQSVCVIIGANVGALITNWILSLTGISSEGSLLLQLLNPSAFSPVLAIIGVVILMKKKSRKKDLGLMLIGFAVLMFGMKTMSDAVAPLKDNESFKHLMVVFQNPILGILVGTLVTAVIQSSSASIGILQALSMSIPINYFTVVPIVLGQNIGTCITAILSSIGANKSAKRVAALHLSYNIIGAAVFMLFYIFLKIYIPVLSRNANPFGIALFNTVFKAFQVIVLFPCYKQLEKLAIRIIPEGKENDEFDLLDERFFDSPSLAVSQAREVTIKMFSKAQDILTRSIDLIENYTNEGFDYIYEGESKTDMYEDKLGSYLIKLTQHNMNVDDSRQATEFLHLIGDIERIGDHALNIAQAAQEINDKKISLSGSAFEELSKMAAAVNEIISLSIKAFKTNNMETALEIEPLEQVVDRLKIILKNNHIERLKQGNCSVEAGFVFNDMINNFERIGDHCSNIAVSILQMKNDDYSGHEFMNSMKSNNSLFTEKYDAYKKKYNVAKA